MASYKLSDLRMEGWLSLPLLHGPKEIMAMNLHSTIGGSDRIVLVGFKVQPVGLEIM